MNSFNLRQGSLKDQAAAYYVCLKTGNHGKDGEAIFSDDPDALGRIFVGPYLAYEPELSLILEDQEGVCGYALAAFDSRSFFDRYENEWRPQLCEQFPMPQGEPSSWTPTEEVHSWYHQPDYFCPEPYEQYPSHLHIDFLERARGYGFGRRMMEDLMDKLKQMGSPGAHLGVSIRNKQAFVFYERLGFEKLIQVGTETDGCVYLGKKL
jgi:ribosomal protein S18 acetylase RimI-like enzyme